MKNIPVSVRQRLAELAKQRQVAFARLLIQYGAERLLYHLSQSKHAEKFVLKGAMLFAQTIPQGLTREFAVEKQTLWTAFLSRSEQAGDPEFVTLIEKVKKFLLPPLQALSASETFGKCWPKGGTWIDT